MIFLLIFLASCAKSLDEILIDNGEKIIKINAEIADDNDEKAKGLMFREELDENYGMFFVFDDERELTFWMKNTLIPLDMIFIDGNLQIADIKNAVPCRKDPCELYKSSKPAKYVLEVNSGFSTRNNVKIGNKIVLNKKY